MGLVPSWSKDIDFRKNTLNARIETIDENQVFKNITKIDVLLLQVVSFEWRWLDDNGKSKEKKYQIYSSESDIFAFVGLYDTWVNPMTGIAYNSFSIVTTKANEQK